MENNVGTISSIELSNFKGYCLPESGIAKVFDMTEAGRNADLILITGKNGVGKTSLLEAVDLFLNQADVGAESYITTGQRQGSICVNGQPRQLQGKGAAERFRLNTVASFFYQENIKELACNEIIKLLEPENKPAAEIQAGLKALQLKLENWQRSIQSIKYRKNYDEERKLLANRVNKLVGNLPSDSPVRKEFENTTLTLNNGNLQSKWDSQIHNLSIAISKMSNLVEPLGANLSERLGYIGQSLLEYRPSRAIVSDMKNNPDVFTKNSLSVIQALPGETRIARWLPGSNLAVTNPVNTLLIGGGDFYKSKIDELEARLRKFNMQYQVLSEEEAILVGESGSLTGWISSFIENVDSWIAVWENHPNESMISELKGELHNKINSLSILGDARLREIKEIINKISLDGKLVAEELNHMRRALAVSQEVEANSGSFSGLLEKPDSTLLDLKNIMANLLAESKPELSSEFDEEHLVSQLGRIFKSWEQLEREKLEDEINANDLDLVEAAEKIISDALAICKQESGARSQLLSVIGVIPQAELEQLLANMNQLLSGFHFPEDFLPIEIDNIGTEKNPKWNFKTKSGVSFDSLSTGQKTQLAICWTINLNLALQSQLRHRVIGFDDFTTSLDMNQLIPAAVLLRKLAYAADDASWKRQVIVTSHHEDLTNRLLDFLLPPAGKSMKVIQFEDWSPSAGPQYKCYNVDMGNVRSDGMHDAVIRVVNAFF